MFSDIFPDNQNRFVYQHPSAAPKGTTFYIGGKEKADALLNINKDPDAAKDHIDKDIDRIIKEIDNARKNDIVAGEKIRPLNKQERGVVKSLRQVKKDLQKKNVTVLEIYNLAAHVKGTAQIYNAIKAGDPLRGAFALNTTEIPKLGGKAPKKLAGKKEAVEATKWAKLSDNVKEYRKLGKTPNDMKRKTALKKEIKLLASTLIGAKKSIEMGDVTIKKTGYDRYQIALKMGLHTLKQGGGPNAKTVQRTEYLNV